MFKKCLNFKQHNFKTSLKKSWRLNKKGSMKKRSPSLISKTSSNSTANTTHDAQKLAKSKKLINEPLKKNKSASALTKKKGILEQKFPMKTPSNAATTT